MQQVLLRRMGRPVLAGPATSLLVVYDELDLPPGAVRLKRGGGAGGHNGIRDLIAHLGDPGFARLRLGIGHPGVRELVTPYVLSSPPAHERLAIEAAIDAAIEHLPRILDGDLESVMNHLHRRPSSPPRIRGTTRGWVFAAASSVCRMSASPRSSTP